MDYGVRPGQHVFTLDGDDLGQVKELRGDYFKVDASMKPDYWLSMDCVRGGSGSGEAVRLNFEKSRLGDYKTDID